MIESINSPLSVVGVAGMYRTGKSYLMNRVILNKSTGFGVAPTINACTKGIWIWGKPLKGESEDGKITNVLVIDSEGLGAVDQDSTHDCRIFAIVLLISSLFIYNSVGTIDENAINSLSLVINLTKHIQLKSQPGEELDTEDYSQYFPSFLWVLRDFTLQLVDEDGDSITPRGYLESALTQQKGFTDEIEQKNRIRRLVQTFFKDRDCFTMVRPLTDEEQLQNLERKDLKELRSEFIEQVTDLRKLIFKQSKLKYLNGKLVNGEMLAGLLRNYISAINEGAVPNIENAWSYICKGHCQKLFDSCFRQYDERFSEKLIDNFPTSAENIDAIHSFCKQEAVARFKKEGMGEHVEEYAQDLKNKIKDRYFTIAAENRSEFEKLLQQSLRQYYTKIDDKVKNGEYRNYYECERDLQNMRTYFMDLEPQGPNKLGLINEFLFTKCNDVAHFLIKNSQNELENEMSILREAKEKLENDYFSAHDTLNKEKNSLSLKLFELETRKSDLESKNDMLMKKIDAMKGEKNSIEDELSKKLDGEKKRYKEEIAALKQKLTAEEDTRRETEKKLILARSEFDKEMSLLKQGIEFHERSGEQWAKKESSYKEELKDLKERLAIDSKDLKKKYEDMVSKLQSELFTVKDTLAEYQSEIDKKDELNVSTRRDFEDKNKTFQSIIEEKDAAIKEYESRILNMVLKPDENDDSDDLRERYEEAMKKLEEALAKIKEKDEKIKVMTGQHRKEKALLEQTLNFHEIQVSDLKRQLEENKRLNENALNALEGRGEKRTGMSKDMEELKLAYEAKIDQMMQDYDKSRVFLNQKIDQLGETNEDLTKEKSKVVEKYEKVLKELQMKCDTLTDDNRRVNDNLKNVEALKVKEVADLNERYKSKIESLETEIDNLKYKNNTEINIFQTKSEDNMKQLRQFFENEKSRLEKRLNEDRDKYDKTFQGMKEEYENRIRHMNEVFEEQTENMQHEIKELEIQSIANNQRFEQEVASKNQRIEMMEKTLTETKESLDKIQESTSVNLKQALGSFEDERKVLTKKIETQSQDMNMKDLQLFQLKQELEQTTANKERKMAELESQFSEKEKDLSKFREALDAVNAKLQSAADENLDKENKMGKELALSNQKVIEIDTE